jgi:hypothetical protein
MISLTSANRASGYSPTRLRRSKTTTAGAIKGKMSIKSDAKRMARTQAPIANEGL